MPNVDRIRSATPRAATPRTATHAPAPAHAHAHALALLITLAAGLGAAARPAGAQNARAADSAQALAAFRSNIAAIHARDRARYLEHYLQSPHLVRAGPAGLQYGYEPMAAARHHAGPTRSPPHTSGRAARPRRGLRRLPLPRDAGRRAAAASASGCSSAQPTAGRSPSPPRSTRRPARRRPHRADRATLVDGTGAAPVADADVVIAAARSSAPGALRVPLAATSRRSTRAGKWIIPGPRRRARALLADRLGGRPARRARRARALPVRAHHGRAERAPRALLPLLPLLRRHRDVRRGRLPVDLGPARDAERARSRRTSPPPGRCSPPRPLGQPAGRAAVHPHRRRGVHPAGARFLPRTAPTRSRSGTWRPQRHRTPRSRARCIRTAGEEARAAGKPLIVHATGLWQAKDALRPAPGCWCTAWRTAGGRRVHRARAAARHHLHAHAHRRRRLRALPRAQLRCPRYRWRAWTP